ncbi:MAG: hypothetical protein KIT84_31365 [Labilithrix sp.]|nr:hypothetical protein [Labilithrix sp.]MCW5815569.1 hypothetical protein [Labilithrix sp.]
MRRFALLLVLVLGPLACRVYEPANKPIDNCHKTCTEQAKRNCTDDECWRGCEFIIDRLVEREGKNVIACVAGGARRCTDVVWADCAAKIGIHTDGGPPAPPAPTDDE